MAVKRANVTRKEFSMTEKDFTNRIDGLINDYDGGISTSKELRDGILDTLIELVSKVSPFEPEVMPNEVLGGGLIAYQLTEDNKDFLYKKFAQHRLNLIVASHNQSLQYAKLEDGRNADYGDWIIELNGKLIILKEYDSRREA